MIQKVYQTTVQCLPCNQTIERQVSRAVHPKTVRQDSLGLFRTITGCTHEVTVKLETKVLV